MKHGQEIAQGRPEGLLSGLLDIAGVMVDLGQGRIRLATNEQDGSTALQTEAARFLKVDEVRMGRDLELYEIMSRSSSEADGLCHFLGEVVIPLKEKVPAAYEGAAPLVERLGYSVIDAEHHEAWGAIFKPASTD